jgi:uncharacterized protein (TIGR02246 family)
MSPFRPVGVVMLLLSTCVFSACIPRSDRSRSLTARDSSAIDSVKTAYVRAWLADDTSGVLATLDPQAVLLPPGRLPVTGHDAIRQFWWPPDGSHTTITSFTWTLDELEGTPEMAYTRGVSNLVWRYVKDTVRSEQTSRNISLTILRRDADGRWRIVRQMWGPSLPG